MTRRHRGNGETKNATPLLEITPRALALPNEWNEFKLESRCNVDLTHRPVKLIARLSIDY